MPTKSHHGQIIAPVAVSLAFGVMSLVAPATLAVGLSEWLGFPAGNLVAVMITLLAVLAIAWLRSRMTLLRWINDNGVGAFLLALAFVSSILGFMFCWSVASMSGIS
jgi:hypothetical protein